MTETYLARSRLLARALELEAKAAAALSQSRPGFASPEVHLDYVRWSYAARVLRELAGEEPLADAR